MKKTECPYGDKEVDFVDLGHRKYVFCYVCQQKYFEEDYPAKSSKPEKSTISVKKSSHNSVIGQDNGAGNDNIPSDFPKTKRQIEMESRMKKQNKKWKCAVIGTLGGAVLTSEYNSEDNTLDDVLHKVRLDLMTYLSNGFTSPIQIIISEVDA